MAILDVISNSTFCFAIYNYYYSHSILWLIIIMTIVGVVNTIKNSIIYSVAREDIILVGDFPEDNKEEDTKN